MRNLIAFGSVLLVIAPAAAQLTSETESPKPSQGQVEIRFRDDSRLKVLLKEEKVEFDTRYGRLTIPLAEIQSLELGSRVPPELIARVDAAIKKLASGDFKEREAAAAELVSFGVKALPAVLGARNSTDAEVANRAQQIADKIMEGASPEELEQRAVDVLTTADSKITGRVVAPTLKVETTHFGTQTIKLAEAFSIRSLNAIEEEGDDKKAEPDPGNLVNYRDRIGKILSFRVTGSMNGTVWGSDVYTTDSLLASAAVHAGVLKLGQTGIVRVRIVPAPLSFEGSARNGIVSHPWSGHPGAYQIIRRGVMR